MFEEIPFEIIHVGVIECVTPFSVNIIDNGKKENFLLNCEEQTHGRGSGNRKWASLRGNVLSTLNIQEKYLSKNIIKLLPFLVGISICENLNKISKYKFGIKWPNDILCIERKKVCGILVEKHKNFYLISFGINLTKSPELSEIRKGGREPCKLANHSDYIPVALEFSIIICKDICNKIQTYNCEKIIEEWKKKAFLDIKFSKRDDEIGKLYKPIDIDLEGRIKAVDEEGKIEIIDPQFPYIKK